MVRFRRFFRFGLGTLFIVVTLICVVLGTNAWRVLPQRRAVAAISRLGAIVVHDVDVRDHRRWEVARRLGLDAVYSVKSVTINADNYNDDFAKHLTRMPGLRKVQLWAYDKPDGTPTGITDDGLRILATIPTLEYVSLRGHQITNVGLGYLRQRRNIKKVEVVPYK